MMEEKNLEREPERALSDRPPFSGRTTKLIGLFAATALAVSVGCSDSTTSKTTTVPAAGNVAVGPDGKPINDSDYCLDDNNDGYCDDNGSRYSTNSFIWVGGINGDYKTKKYYRSGDPDSSHTYYSSGRGVSSGTSGSSSSATSQPSSNTSQPPTSAKGSGQVISRSSGTGSASSGSASSSSGSSSSQSSSGSESSSSGVSSSSGKGGIGSSSSSSSS